MRSSRVGSKRVCRSPVFQWAFLPVLCPSCAGAGETLDVRVTLGHRMWLEVCTGLPCTAVRNTVEFAQSAPCGAPFVFKARCRQCTKSQRVQARKAVSAISFGYQSSACMSDFTFRLTYTVLQRSMYLSLANGAGPCVHPVQTNHTMPRLFQSRRQDLFSRCFGPQPKTFFI